MAKNVSTQTTPKLPTVFASAFEEFDVAEYTEGAGMSFDMLSIRGSKFRLKSGGTEEVIVNDDGDAVAGINVIFIKSKRNLSKRYYKEKWVEGSDGSPECWSIDGTKPDPSVSDRQSVLCASCPQNVFGSAVTEAGSEAKACADYRRIAVNLYDGDPELKRDPVLLRVPVMSLRALADYARKLKKIGWPTFGVVTRLAFDHETAYPRLTFRPVGVVSDDAVAARIMELRESETVEQILTSGVDAATAEAAAIEDDPVATEMAKTAKPVAFAKPKAEAKSAKPAGPDPDPEPEAVEEAEEAPVTNVKQADDDELPSLFGVEEEKPKPAAAKGNGKAATKAPATAKPQQQKAAAKPPAEEHVANATVESTLDNIFADFES